MLFLTRLHATCHRLPHKVALELPGADGAVVTLRYGQLEDAVQRAIAFLQDHDIGRGDRVALQLPKCIPFIVLHLAVMRLEAICLPLNPAYPMRELRYYLADAGVKLLVAESDSAGAVARLRSELPELRHVVAIDPFSFRFTQPPAGYGAGPTDPAAIALIIYTSGTTGRPKGAMLSHGNLTANLDSLHIAWGWREQDVLLHVLPIFHVHGLIVALLGALNAGATVTLLPQFDAHDLLGRLASGRYTVFMGVPTIHRRLLDVARSMDAGRFDFGRMRLLTSGSDRLPDDLFAAYQTQFNVTLLERYGMSETGMLISNPLHGERRVGSVGMPLPGVEVRVVNSEVGETPDPLPDGVVGVLEVRGANVCAGYWRRPEQSAAAFSADGWFRTGDLGVRAPDGYITLKGRAKDLIITGGYNVYPPEVELVLADHPGVAASAVIGCPDRAWGERVTALIVPETGVSLTEAEIIVYCRERLVPYKAPRRVVLVDRLPRNALGKVQKAQLRQQWCVGSQR